MPYLTKIIKEYSDGTKTTIECKPNPNADEIEAKVAEAISGDHKLSEVTASEPVEVLDKATKTSTKKVK